MKKLFLTLIGAVIFSSTSLTANAKTVSIYVPKTGGTNGYVLVSAGDRKQPYWANVVGDKMYQHNIYCYDSDTTYSMSFSFVNAVATPYTTSAAISQALYNLGHTNRVTSVTANGFSGTSSSAKGGYICVYGTNDGACFYYLKTTSGGFGRVEWGSYTDTVTPVSHSTLAVNSGVNASGLSFDDIYPIGSIYFNVGETLPPIFTAEGRTWVKITNGTFLMSADGTTTVAGATGGANSKTLTTDNMPSHTHSVSGTTSENGSHTHERKGWWGFTYDQTSGKYGASRDYISGDTPTYGTEAAGDHTHTYSTTSGSTGSGTAFDNRPSFLAVSMWKRTH